MTLTLKLDLDMIKMYHHTKNELDPDMIKMYHHTKNEVFMSTVSKVTARIDRQTQTQRERQTLRKHYFYRTSER